MNVPVVSTFYFHKYTSHTARVERRVHITRTLKRHKIIFGHRFLLKSSTSIIMCQVRKEECFYTCELKVQNLISIVVANKILDIFISNYFSDTIRFLAFCYKTNPQKANAWNFSYIYKHDYFACVKIDTPPGYTVTCVFYTSVFKHHTALSGLATMDAWIADYTWYEGTQQIPEITHDVITS